MEVQGQEDIEEETYETDEEETYEHTQYEEEGIENIIWCLVRMKKMRRKHAQNNIGHYCKSLCMQNCVESIQYFS